MDDYGVLDRLIYNHASLVDAEPLAMALGMVHLYRTSGVHLLAFLTLLNLGIDYLGKTFGFRAEIARLISLIFCAFAIFWIWSLQDYRPTLIRPILTFLIRKYFMLRGAQSKFILPLILTFIFEFLLSSSTTFSEGAFHYYVSVAGGLTAYHAYQQSNALRRHLALALGSWLPVALVSLVSSHLISFLTALYSLISLPIISLVLYPLTLVDVLLHHQISDSTIAFWNHFISFLFSLADWLPGLVSVDSKSIILALPFAVLAVYLNAQKRLNPSHGVALLTLLIFFRFGMQGHFQTTEVSQLDVGQGDSALLKDRSGRVEMVDVGSLKTFALKDWLQKISAHNVSHIDGILLSHLDEDHVGALKVLLKIVPVACVETNASLWQSEKGIRLKEWIANHAQATLTLPSGCMRLPKIAWFESHKKSGNELMAGIVYAPNSNEAYFAEGDADEEQELSYERYFKSEIDAHPVRIWKASHHGSRFSSNEGFLKRLAPEVVWISVGKHNPYHHPHPITLQKLSRLNEPYYRTDEAGDVTRSFSE